MFVVAKGLVLTRRLRPGYGYLAHRKIGGLLVQARRGVFAGDIARFATAATDLDYGGHIVKRTAERVVLRLLIQTGRPLDEVVVAEVDELAAAFRRRAEVKGNRSNWVNDRSLVYAAHRVLFHLGVLDTPPEDPRRRPGRALQRRRRTAADARPRLLRPGRRHPGTGHRRLWPGWPRHPPGRCYR